MWLDLADPDNLAGVAGLLGAVVFWSIGSLYSKYVKVAVHPLMGASIQMLIAGIVLSGIGVAIGELPPLDFEITGLLSLAYLVVIGSLVGYSSYIYVIAKLPLSLVSTYAYINPIIAVSLGTLLLGERFDLRMLLAIGIVLARLAVVSRARQATNPGAERASMQPVGETRAVVGRPSR